LAEEAGFDFAVIGDHYVLWLAVQGHAPYAWSVLGAAAQATDQLPLMTYVTCPIGIAVSGPPSCRLAGRQADAMIAVEPRAELGQMFEEAGGSAKPRIGQLAVSYDPDPQTAVQRATEQFGWFTGGWPVNAELPVPASFEVASRTVRKEDVATQMPCGPDLGRHLAGIRQFEAAGFTHLALVQVGADTQERFISWAATQLLPALRGS
jgi:G6PDH family F420-dependent oxidoreductase